MAVVQTAAQPNNRVAIEAARTWRSATGAAEAAAGAAAVTCARSAWALTRSPAD